MRVLLILCTCFSLSGCAYYMTPRPPIMERKLGTPFSESHGVLATAADYRAMVFETKNGVARSTDGKSGAAKFCAEPPPDAAAQYAAQLSSSLTQAAVKDAKISAEVQASLAVSMKQLFQRSQGIQMYRDGLFALCNMYLNGALSDEAYLAEVKELRKTAALLIRAEIPLAQRQFDSTVTPALPGATPKKESALGATPPTPAVSASK